MADQNQCTRSLQEECWLLLAKVAILIVFFIAGTISLGCIVWPPSLMDDVDAVQAQEIARNMLTCSNG